MGLFRFAVGAQLPYVPVVGSSGNVMRRRMHVHSREETSGAGERLRSTSIPATIVLFNIVASIRGTVAVKH
ncbi:hypothetical protein ACVWWO_000228 [Bradyrhizobium sp. F1.13.1]